MRYRIEFVDHLMQLLDENNYGHDAHIVTAGREGVHAAKMKINEWRTQYEFDTVKAKREVSRLVEKM